MKKLDINTVLIGGVLVAAIVFFGFQRFTQTAGGTAVVAVDGTDEEIKISLAEDKIYHIDSGKLPVTLQVENGAIRFIESKCPDHICEGYGYISNVDQSAVCLPAGVAVMVTKENSTK